MACCVDCANNHAIKRGLKTSIDNTFEIAVARANKVAFENFSRAIDKLIMNMLIDIAFDSAEKQEPEVIDLNEEFEKSGIGIDW